MPASGSTQPKVAIGGTPPGYYSTTSTSIITSGPGGASTPQVTVYPPSPADTAAIVKATDLHIVATCSAEVIPGSERFATIRATDQSWAIAQFRPSPGCKVYMGPAANQIGPQPVDPYRFVDLFQNAGGGPEEAVFERQASGICRYTPAQGGACSAGWDFNDLGGSPFPYPGQAPGEGSIIIPVPVLTAWHLPYAKHCDTLQVGGH